MYIMNENVHRFKQFGNDYILLQLYTYAYDVTFVMLSIP